MAAIEPRCVLGITLDDLSAWRDQMLDAHAAQALAAHVPACAACQQRLDRFDTFAQMMQRQHAPNLHDHVWHAMQPRLGAPTQRGMPRQAILGGLGAALVVAILFIAVVVFSPHRVGGSPPITTMPTARLTATAPGQPTSTSPTALTPTQAWGNYATQTITSPATGGYALQDLFPDGTAVVGTRFTGSDSTVFATIPTAQPTNPHVVYTTPAGTGPLFARTDGRFIAWMSTLRDSGGPDAGHQFAGYLDLQTQRVTLLANGGQTSVAEMVVDHGDLLWVPEINGHLALAVVNMLTGESTTIVPNLSGGTVPEIQFSYPDVFYIDSMTDSTTDGMTAHLYDIATGHDTVLAQMQPLVSTLDAFALDGSTLFWAHGVSGIVAVDEIDHADQEGAPLQRVTEYAVTSSQVFLYNLAANDRLIAWGGTGGMFAWDRHQHRLVAVAADAYDTALFIRGATFAFSTNSGTDSAYTFIDTATLPATAPR